MADKVMTEVVRMKMMTVIVVTVTVTTMTAAAQSTTYLSDAVLSTL